jgi:translation initiation factor IF-2
MKVKDLAPILKMSCSELLSLLDVVGIDTKEKEETMVDTINEKKLASRCNIAYPFKKNGAKPKQKPVPSVHISLIKKTPTPASQSPRPNSNVGKPNVNQSQQVAPKTKPVARPVQQEAKVAKPEGKPEVKPEGKPVAKTEVKPEGKPVAKTEVKPESKPEAKPEAKVEAKPVVKSEVKTPVNTDARPAARPETNVSRPQGYAPRPQQQTMNSRPQSSQGARPQNSSYQRPQQTNHSPRPQQTSGYNRYNNNGNYNNNYNNNYSNNNYNNNNYNNNNGYNNGSNYNNNSNYNNGPRNSYGNNTRYNSNNSNRRYNDSPRNDYNRNPVKKVVAPTPATPVKKKIVNVEQKINYIDEIATAKIDVDEKFLDKYDSLIEEDEEGTQKLVHKKAATADDKTKPSRKKNSNKNKTVAKQEGRTSNIPLNANSQDHVLYYEDGMTVTDIAAGLNISVTELVKKLFVGMGIMANATQTLERDTTELVAVEYNYEVKDKQITDLARFDEIKVEDDASTLVERPPVVTIMGHVDHGKTTLLDTIRSSHVVKSEAGGITQRIGAYQVKKNDRYITFIDTPGHAAFTEMRARGAQITDIVVLVVAADDGVMPQTVEAIDHAKAAGVPIIVAINKMDKVGANPDHVKQELSKYNLLPEEWGGETIYVPLSALTGKGVDDLLENILLVADVHEYKANPNRLGMGTVIEARLDKGRGPVATLLVQNGTLKVGDVIVVGTTYGKIRAMQDELGRAVSQATPSKPIEVTGLDEVPFAGEKFMALNDEKQARTVSETRAQNKFRLENAKKAATLAEVFKEQQNDNIKTLNLIIKCDIQGSVEAVKSLLEKISIEGVQINIIGAHVGGITDNDISLAIASKAIIIGFNIRPNAQITDLAKDKGVEIRLYDIIYKLQEDIEKAAKGLLDPIFAEKVTGQAEVRNIFKISKIGTVAGCMVTNGSIVRNGRIRVIRDSVVAYTGNFAGLRRVKDDVKEVKEGFECGISIENFNDIKVGDILECFIMEEQERE